MEEFTVEEFQTDFDELISRVESGESFIIKDGDNTAVIVPYKETIKYALESLTSDPDDELIRIHTEHCDGC